MTPRIKPLDLTGRTVLVTGGSSGIGRETAVVLSELGCRVVVTGRRADQLELTLRQMSEGAHAVEPFDLSDLNAIPEWIKSVAERYGPFNGIVHAAGIRKTVGLRGLSLEV